MVSLGQNESMKWDYPWCFKHQHINHMFQHSGLCQDISHIYSWLGYIWDESTILKTNGNLEENSKLVFNKCLLSELNTKFKKGMQLSMIPTHFIYYIENIPYTCNHFYILPVSLGQDNRFCEFMWVICPYMMLSWHGSAFPVIITGLLCGTPNGHW